MTQLIGYPGHRVFLKDIVRAENCSLYDSDGTRYVDLESGVWCTSIGHGHPRVIKALCEQAARIGHAGFNYSSRIVEEAAAEILSLLGMVDGKCTFLCSGSEAVEFGVRVARMITERPLFMTMTDSYFGAFGSASEEHASGWFRFDWTGCAECPDSMQCETECERWASMPLDRVGAFLFEPGSSSGNVRFPPRKLIQSIAREVGTAGGLVMVNEVTTGIGRTGTWFGFEHYDITPDIVALGKGIGNGYPVSVAAFSATAVERLGGQPIRWAQSHQNDPLGAAVALEVLRTLTEERLIERGKEMADLLYSALNDIREKTGKIAAIRARGLMVALELVDDGDATSTTQTFHTLLERGFIVAQRPGMNVLRIDPPLTIDRDDLEAFLECLGTVLHEAPPPDA